MKHSAHKTDVEVEGVGKAVQLVLSSHDEDGLQMEFDGVFVDPQEAHDLAAFWTTGGAPMIRAACRLHPTFGDAPSRPGEHGIDYFAWDIQYTDEIDGAHRFLLRLPLSEPFTAGSLAEGLRGHLADMEEDEDQDLSGLKFQLLGWHSIYDETETIAFAYSIDDGLTISMVTGIAEMRITRSGRARRAAKFNAKHED